VKLPFCKFYPRDWIADTQLRSCSFAERGLWADLLCLMGMNDRRGYLELAGKPLTDPAQIARLTGGEASEVQRLMEGLEAAGVFSRDARECIFSRRMVADAERSEVGRKEGLKGGNPVLTTRQPLTGGVNPPPYPQGYPGGINSEPRTQNPEESIRASSDSPQAGSNETRFRIPTIQRVKQEAVALGKSEDEAEAFWNHYESIGWEEQDRPIRNWIVRLRAWRNAGECE
jgi:hypothetical protein